MIVGRLFLVFVGINIFNLCVISYFTLHQLVSRAEVPVKMPLRRNRPLTEAYEQEFEQRVIARMEERLDQFQPDRPRRNQWEDNRRWESGMRVNILEFDGNTLNPDGFIDWLVAVEEGIRMVAAIETD
ncbi:hypothetical protein Tco_1299943 [Tanacetum coccineum]